ncbi:MAG: DUF1501 domain-containing protein [Planctomycetia bacterium]|nr:DUF1501 domain-containing protein [Planctomycetia bacterium]
MNSKNSRIGRDALRFVTRRHFFHDCRIGLGSLALASLLDPRVLAAPGAGNAGAGDLRSANPMAPRPAHFAGKAKRVIYLFMAGGPSQLELFDFKPKLQELDGQQVPESYVKNKRFAFIKHDAKLLGTRRKFARYGQSGAEISKCLPQLALIADEVCLVRSIQTDVFNHGPAKLFINTGSPRFSNRPSMGSWVTYGIGSAADDLPGFVVLQSGPRGPRGGSPLWGSGFLPTTFQGVPLRSGGEPILNLQNPSGIDASAQGAFVDAVKALNLSRLDAVGDPEIATRTAAYEMAYRMQSSAPELIDLSGETRETLEMYGVVPGKASFANNCLLARRLIERGVRFVQLYHTDWDHHGNSDTNLGKPLDERCGEVDKPSAALVRDLAQRGLLDDTLVIWGGEFGRTPMGEPRELIGRDHHTDNFTMWFAGGGIKAGQTIGETDELGFYVTQDPVHVHDIQATVLHLLGLDHLKLTFRFQGRDFRLTDVAGKVVQKMLA